MTKKNIITIIAALILLFSGCGKKESNKVNDKVNKKKPDPAITKLNKTKFSNYAVDKDGKRVPEIKAVTFTSKPLENRDLEADVHLTIPDEDLEFKYTWIVNDKRMEGIDSNILPKENIKNGDWAYCKAKIINGPVETREISSKRVRILGTVPILKLDPVPPIKVPGEFKYTINAYLPGDDLSENEINENTKEDLEENVYDFPEGSGLVYELISPTDKEIFLSETTGEINWFISEDIAAALGEKVVIKFRVKNPDGGSVTSSITLSFKQRESDEIPKSPLNGKEVE